MMLSELLRFTIGDARGQPARLRDLAVDLSAGDYPPITHLFFQHARQPLQRVSWAAVEGIEWSAHKLRIRDRQTLEQVPPEALKHTVLLKRDILDALVLDLANRAATLANDLWLHEQAGQLLLRGADVSPWAVVRRLSRGLFGHGTDRHLLDWKDVEFLRGDPQAARAGGDYHRRVTRLQPAVIAHLVEAVPYLHAAELLALLPDTLTADALEVMAPERQLQVFEELPPETAVRLLSLMSPDAAADLIGHLRPELARDVLEQLSTTKRERLIALLRYPEDSAGGLMTNDMVIVPAALSVGEVRQSVRTQLQEPDFIYYLYVVDDEVTRRLCGVFTLRDLLLADDSQSISDVMSVPLEVIDPLEPADRAAQRVIDNSLAALPVVGRNSQLIGAITADAAVARLAPRAWREQAPRVFS
jgi:magnesium transporter